MINGRDIATTTIVLFLIADWEKAHLNLILSFNEVMAIELSLGRSVKVIKEGVSSLKPVCGANWHRDLAQI